MATFPEALNSAERVEYLLYVHGMPWAVATSEDAIRSLDGSIWRSALFGAETYAGGGKYFADDVDIYPLLQIPGIQDIRNEDAMAGLAGGTWTAQIADDPIRPSLWGHSARTTILGLEGVQAIASPQIDPSILTGRLYESLPRDHLSVKWIDDPGGLLYAAAAAASRSHPLVVWLGQECFSISSATKTGDIVTAQIDKRGILETSDYYHATNKITAGAPPVRIANAPLWGVQNRPYTLFALICTGSGASCQVTSYGRIRHGKISGDVSYKTGMWSIQMLPWWAWLDTELQVDKVSANLAKFVVTRPFWGVDETNCDICGAHVVFREWVEATTTMSSHVEVWLCDPGESATYETIEDLENALCAAMTTASPNGWLYKASELGPYCGSDLEVDDRVYLDGSLLMVLGWHTSRRNPYDATGNPYGWTTTCTSGETFSGLGSDEQIVWNARNENVRHSSGGGALFTSGHSGVKTLMYKDFATDPEWSVGSGWFFNVVLDAKTQDYYEYQESIGGVRYLPDYLLSWGWEDTEASEQHAAIMRKDFPIPIDRVAAEARIWVSTATDVTNMGGGTIVQLGDYSCSWDESNNTLSNFVTESAGAGGLLANYVVASATDEDYLTAIGSPAIIGSSLSGWPERFVRGTIIWGGSLQAMSVSDPEYGWGLTSAWPMIQSYDITLPKIGDIYRALMGTGAYGDEVAQEIQVDHIPMSWTLDSTQLDEMISSSAMPFDVRYMLRYSGAINLWKVLIQELQFHGLTMVYQWDEGHNQYVIRFRRFVTTSATVAMLTGKIIGDHVIDSQTKTSVEHSTGWQINAAEISVNYDPELKDYLYRFDICDASGYEPTGGKINKLTIEPTITWVRNLDQADVQAALIAWLSSMFEGTAYPRPSLKFDAAITDCCALSVGSDTLATVKGIHNPFSGALDLTASSAWIVGQSIDPSRSQVKYEISVSPREVHGWSPTCWITETTSTTETGEIPIETNLLVDGDMEAAGVGDWGFLDSILTKEGAPHTGIQCLRVTAIAALGWKSPQWLQSVIVSGKKYHVVGWARSDAVGRVPRLFDNAFGDVWVGNTSTLWQPINIVFTAIGNTLLGYFAIFDASGGEYVEFDDLIVYEIADEAVVEVVDIGGGGQEFCDSGNTIGWFDHWFFADINYNETMTNATLASSTQYACRLVEKDSKYPALIENVVCTMANTKNYHDVATASESYLTLFLPDAHLWDDAKEWYLIFEGFDSADLADNQKNYMFIADDDLLLTDSTAATRPGKTWV